MVHFQCELLLETDTRDILGRQSQSSAGYIATKSWSSSTNSQMTTSLTEGALAAPDRLRFNLIICPVASLENGAKGKKGETVIQLLNVFERKKIDSDRLINDS